MNTTTDNARTILDAGAAAVEVRNIPEHAQGDTSPFVVTPSGYNVHDLEHLLPQPLRKRANVSVSDTASFIEYVKKHGVTDQTVIYANINADKSQYNLIAVIDDHAPNSAHWRGHTCGFNPALSVEWGRWNGHNRKVMSQSEFATFLEDNLPDIATVPNMPTGSDILQMAVAFEANADKRMRSKVDLQSGGAEFVFVDQQDENTMSKMKVFGRFTIGIPVFDGSTDAYPIEARLKFRIKDGAVAFWFELVRPDRVFKTAVSDSVKAIKDQTGFLLLNGKPNTRD